MYVVFLSSLYTMIFVQVVVLQSFLVVFRSSMVVLKSNHEIFVNLLLVEFGQVMASVPAEFSMVVPFGRSCRPICVSCDIRMLASCAGLFCSMLVLDSSVSNRGPKSSV